MSGFRFTSQCDCRGELSELTQSKPDDFTSSCRVVCRSCGTQWSIDVLMTPYRPWSNEMARMRAVDALEDETSGQFNKRTVAVDA